MADTKLNHLLERFAQRDRLGLARLITLVENRAAQVSAVMERVYALTGHAYTIGITGAPGAGKSTRQPADRQISCARKTGGRAGD